MAMCETVNHALCYKSALSFTHHFANNFATGIHYLGNLGNVEIRRVTNRTFLANPNTVHGSADHTLTIADSDMEGDLKIARIDIPFISPFVQHLQIVLRFQAHEYNIDPSEGLYSDLFTAPFSVDPSGSTAGSGLATLSDFMHYVDNPSAGMPQIETGKPAVPPVQFSSSDFLDCDLRFRLRDASGTIIDPASGSGWAVTLSHTNGGLRTGEGFKAEDTFPVREVALSVPSRIGATASERPRALEYGSARGTGGGVVLEIGYKFVRPLVATVSEVPPVVQETATFSPPPAFPADFPTSSSEPNTASSSAGVALNGVYLYKDHIYIRFTFGLAWTSDPQYHHMNGVVFFPEPPKSTWPLGGLDLSAAGVDANPNLFYGHQAGNLYHHQRFTYFGNELDDNAGGELRWKGPEDRPGYTGTPVPGSGISNMNHWLTAPSAHSNHATMGDLVLANGGKVWHPHLGNFPSEVVLTSGYDYTVNVAESGTRAPTLSDDAFVRVPVSSVTAWGGVLNQGEFKSMTAFTIYDHWLTEVADIYHAQSGNSPNVGGIAGNHLAYIFGITRSEGIVNILESSANLANIKAQFDAMGIP